MNELMMNDFFLLISIIVGLLTGSFLNVCIFRIPRDESVVFPSSHCPGCFTTLNALDLIPLLAWFFYGRRCRYCGKLISFRYPAMEIITAILFAAAFMKYGIGLSFFVVLILMGYFIVVTMIDYDFQVIPDSINWPFFFVGLIIHGLVGYFSPGMTFDNINIVFSLKTSILGALTGGGLLWLIAVLSNGGMGMGDVKFALAIGSFLGPLVTLQILFISFFLGAFFGVFFILLKIKKRKDYIPFGPYIAAAAVIVLLVGAENMSKLYWYLMIFRI